jgi:hypothetical protein
MSKVRVAKSPSRACIYPPEHWQNSQQIIVNILAHKIRWISCRTMEARRIISVIVRTTFRRFAAGILMSFLFNQIGATLKLQTWIFGGVKPIKNSLNISSPRVVFTMRWGLVTHSHLLVLSQKQRWGDAPVHSIAASLFARKDQVHFFGNIGYQHEFIQHCPTGQAWVKGRCACDYRETFGTWYCSLPSMTSHQSYKTITPILASEDIATCLSN